MAVVDSLEVQIQGSAKTASQSLDELVNKLSVLATSLSKINVNKISTEFAKLPKSVSSINGNAFKNFSDYAKNAENSMSKIIKEASKGINAKTTFDVSDFEKVAAELSKKFTDVGKNIKFTGDVSALERQYNNLSKHLDNLAEKENKIISVGKKSPFGEVFQNLQYDIASTLNQMGELSEKIKSLKIETPYVDLSKLSDNELTEWLNNLPSVAEKSVMEVNSNLSQIDSPKIADINPESWNYSNNAIKEIFGETARNIKNWSQALNQFGQNAGMVMNSFAVNSDSVKNETSELAEKLKLLQIPPINETNLVKLQNELKNTETKLEELKAKLANSLTMGTIKNSISDKGFVRLQEQIALTEKKAQTLKDRIQEVDSASKNVNGFRSLSGVSDGISSSFSNLSNVSKNTTNAINRMNLGFKNLLRTILPFLGIRQIFNWGKNAIETASDLAEVQNVVDVTFGKYANLVDKMVEISIPEFGMSELTAKQISSRFQAMGTAMGFAQGEMANTSIELTKLAADMASFYNVEQTAVAEDLESIFTGTTRPLRQYGLDLTEATLKEWALKQGLDADIKSMSQAQKTLLRYQYVLANTNAAQGDFARTANTWANAVRVLKQNFQQLGAIVGGTLINVFKPFVQALNSVMQKVITFAKTVANALGKIFGWKMEISTTGITDDIGGVSDYADEAAGGIEAGADAAEDEANNLDKAQKAARKLRDYTLGIDELNIIRPDDVDDIDDLTSNLDKIKNPSNENSGTGTGAGGGDVESGLAKTESIFDKFKSEIDTLYELGEYIRDALIGAMESIDWDSIYEKARGFGKGLAEFLNGLFAYDGEGRTLFGEIGKTLANTLNTIIYAALEFAKEFDFHQFGVNLADGINRFFQNFDFAALAETLNKWVDGLKNTIIGFLSKLSWKDIISGIGNFLGNLELDTVSFVIGAFALKHAGKLLTASAFKKVIMEKLGITAGTMFEFSIHIALLAAIAFVGGSIKEQIDEIFAEDSFYNIPIEWKTGTEDWGLGDYIASTFDVLKLNVQRGLEGIKIDIELWWQDTWLSNKIWELGQWVDNFKAQFGKGFDLFKEGAAQAVTEAKNNFSELGKYWSDLFSTLGSNISNWFENSVKPWFTAERWGELWESIKTTFSTKWSEITEWWNSSAIVTWWNDSVAPWFTVEKWSELWEQIKTAFSTKWNEIAEWWNGTAIVGWWENSVKPWFTVEKWLEVLQGVRDGIEQKWTEALTWWDEFTNTTIPTIIENIKGFFEELPDKIKEIGGNLISGFIEGVKEKWEEVKDTVTEFCGDVMDWFKSGFDEHSPSKKTKEVGVYLVEGLLLPFQDSTLLSPLDTYIEMFLNVLRNGFSADRFADIFNNILIAFQTKWNEIMSWWNEGAMTVWWESYVMPWFTFEKWHDELLINIPLAFQTMWDELLMWWNEEAMTVWWEEYVMPWFEVERWKEMLDNIRIAFTNEWKLISDWWKKTLDSWWKDDVLPRFTYEKWFMMLENVRLAFEQTWNIVRNKADAKMQETYTVVRSWCDQMLSAIAEVASAIDGVIAKLNSLGGMGISGSISLDIGGVSIGGFAAGGFPSSYSLFMAGEYGRPELLGTVGGKTAVAGSEEITGIRQAVYDSGETQASLLQTAIALLQEIAEKDMSVAIGDDEIFSSYQRGKERHGVVFTG